MQYKSFDGSAVEHLVTSDFNLRVTKRTLIGYDAIDKFGENRIVTTSTDPEDIWDGGGVYTYTENNGAIHYVSSSSLLDTQEFTFSVLTADSNGNWNNEEFSQNLAGQTKTQLNPPSGDPIVRVYRVQNNGLRQEALDGDVYIYEDTTVTAGVPTDLTKLRAKVLKENNQTAMAMYTIPTGKVGFLFRGELGMNFTGAVGAGTNFAKLAYQSARFNKVFTVKKIISCINQASSSYQDTRSFPDIIPAKTDIKLSCLEVSDDMGVWGTMDILLIDEDMLDDELLTAIGQIKRVE